MLGSNTQMGWGEGGAGVRVLTDTATLKATVQQLGDGATRGTLKRVTVSAPCEKTKAPANVSILPSWDLNQQPSNYRRRRLFQTGAGGGYKNPSTDWLIAT